jgi:hypothetical protein
MIFFQSIKYKTTGISYDTALEISKEFMAGPERFELPTAGFEDQNSSTELRTDILGRG